MKQNNYPKQKLVALEKPLIFVVDMINGFVCEGALADPAIAKAAKPIADLIENSKADTLFIRDAHTTQAREFASFPVHCLQGEKESEVIDSLAKYEKQTIFKNSTNAFMAPAFQKKLEQLCTYREWIITGCCTDLCVLQLALSLQGWLNEHDMKDIKILVPADCVDTYHIEGVHDACFWNEAALANMAANGIQVASSLEE
jgi:nicotinamidase-related amidase